MNRNTSVTPVGDQVSIESLLEAIRDDGDLQKDISPRRVETGSSTNVSPIRLNATSIAKQHPSRLVQPKVHTPRKSQTGSPDGAPKAIAKKDIAQSPVALDDSENKSKDSRQASQKKTTPPKRSPGLKKTTQTAPSRLKADLQLPTLNPRGAMATRSPSSRAKIEPLPSTKLHKFKLKGAQETTTAISPKDQRNATRTDNVKEHNEVMSPCSPVSNHNQGETSQPTNVSNDVDSQSRVSRTYMRHFQQEFEIDQDECLLSEDSDLDEVENESMVCTTSDDGFDWTQIDPGNDEDIKSTATKEEDMSVDTEAGHLFQMVDADLPRSEDSESANVKGEEPTEVRGKVRDLDQLAEVGSSKSTTQALLPASNDVDEMDSSSEENTQAATPKIKQPSLEESTQVHPLRDNDGFENLKPSPDGEMRELFNMAEAATVHTRNIKSVAKTEGARKGSGYRKQMYDHERTERTDEDLSGRSTDLDDIQPLTQGKVKQTEPRRSIWCCCCLP